MSLRHVVPTLGLVAATALPLSAADIGGLSINGYVDSVLAIEDGDLVGDDTVIAFSAEAKLEIGYAVSDVVSAVMSLRMGESFLEEDISLSGIELEEAYINWQIAPEVSLTMGRFHNWLGWEGVDATELYRVNTSIVDQTFNGNIVTGLGVGFEATEDLRFGLYIVNDVYDSQAGTGQETDDLAIAVDGLFRVEGIGSFGGSFTFQMEDEDIMAVNVWAEIDALREDMGLLFAADLHYWSQDDIDMIGAMIMGNMKFDAQFPMSATAMFSYINVDNGNDQDWFEFAAALLTNPTNDENFSVNLEVRYVDMDDDDDAIGVYLEMLAIIP